MSNVERYPKIVAKLREVYELDPLAGRSSFFVDLVEMHAPVANGLLYECGGCDQSDWPCRNAQMVLDMPHGDGDVLEGT